MNTFITIGGLTANQSMEIPRYTNPEKISPLYENLNGSKYVINPYAHLQLSQRKNFNTIQMEATDKNANLCRICNRNFKTHDEFVIHNSVMHYKRKHQCTWCPVSFHRHDHLKRHVKSLHTSDTHPCALCEKIFGTRDILLRHMESKHSLEAHSFKCKDCLEVFASIPHLEEHEKQLHMMTERHRCPHCEGTFKRRDHMLRHIKTQHMHQVIHCQVCNQPFKRKDHVTRHMREKHRTL